MRKLVLILIALIAIVTFIRSVEGSLTAEEHTSAAAVQPIPVAHD